MADMIYWVRTINMAGNFLVCLYVFCKAINKTISVSQKVYSILWCLFWGVLYSVKPYFIPEPLVRPILCVVSIIFIWKIIKINLDMAVSAYLLSFGINYFFHYVAGVLISLISIPFLAVTYDATSFVDFGKPIYLLICVLIIFLQYILAYLLFRIKRFRNGFPFLFKNYTVVLSLIISSMVLVLVSLLAAPRESPNEYANTIVFLYVAGIIIIGEGIIIWIRRGILVSYNRRMKERSNNMFQQELAEMKKENQMLTEQNNILRIESHKILHRLAASERSFKELLEIVQSQSHMYSAEISEDVAVSLESLERLSREYKDGVGQIKVKKPLPSTYIQGLDDLFELFSSKYVDNNIDFNLQVNGSIPFMAENIIHHSKLEIMIGDHLQNALIAVNASGNSLRSVLAIIGLAEDCYMFMVCDSGIPFEVDTLVHLGTEYVTTHTETGGNGIGFMTTFETMKECNASLIIHEKNMSSTDYSKSITIRFDGKRQYIIETYRPDDFPKQNDRYTVVASRMLKAIR